MTHVRDKWIPLITDNYINIKTNSWFDITSLKKDQVFKSVKVCHNNNTIIRTKKIKLYPTDMQKEILQKWFNLDRKMYNKTTVFLRGKIYKNNNKLNNKAIQKYVNFRNLRSKYLSKDKENLCKYNINKHILDQSIARCVAMYKSAITKLKNRIIDHFRIRRLKKDKRYKVMLIEGCLFSRAKNGFCISVLKEISSEESIIGIRETCVLIYDRYKSTYVLSVPKYINPEKNSTRKLVCGIDPGVRTFLAVYSKKECNTIGNNINFDKYYKKIDRLNQIFESANSKETRKCKCTISKINDKITNKVRDMHFKVGKFLCTNYSILKLGKLSTNKIVSNERSVLKKSTKRLLYSLSHYRFRERLAYQAEKYGVKLKIVSEYQTTIKCSNCKKINNVKSKKTYKCIKCNLIADRDMNAAKNIRYV